MGKNGVDTKAELRRDFEQKAAVYCARAYGSRSITSVARLERRDLILQLVRDKVHGGTILDVGCGPGIVYPELVDTCRRYLALDMVPLNLGCIEAKFREPKVVTVCADIDNYRPEPGQFDTVIAAGSIEYTNQPEANLVKFLDGVAPGGRLVASLPNRRSPYRLWSESVYQPCRRRAHRLLGRAEPTYPRQLFDGQEICKLLVRAQGVSSVSLLYFSHRVIPQPLSRLTWRLEAWISGWLTKNQMSWRTISGTEFLVIVDKIL